MAGYHHALRLTIKAVYIKAEQIYQAFDKIDLLRSRFASTFGALQFVAEWGCKQVKRAENVAGCAVEPVAPPYFEKPNKVLPRTRVN